MIDVRLAAVRRASENVKLFELEAATGRPLPPLPPGSHVDLRVPSDAIRPYFVAARSKRGGYVIGVRRDPDGNVSKQLHDKVRVGALLQLQPRPSTPFARVSSRATVIAEDVGVFNAWPLLHAFDRAGVPFEVHYDAWSREDAPLLRELAIYGRAVRVTFRSERGGRGPDAASVVREARGDARFFGSGSPATARALAAAMLEDGRGFAESVRWTSAERERESSPIEFDVVLARSGNRTVPVHANESILDALERAGVRANHFCRGGICGVCRTRVLEGVPLHRDAVLSASERAANDVMMICRSRASGARLVLDL